MKRIVSSSFVESYCPRCEREVIFDESHILEIEDDEVVDEEVEYTCRICSFVTDSIDRE